MATGKLKIGITRRLRESTHIVFFGDRCPLCYRPLSEHSTVLYSNTEYEFRPCPHQPEHPK
jgi:hypothetical protein